MNQSEKLTIVDAELKRMADSRQKLVEEQSAAVRQVEFGNRLVAHWNQQLEYSANSITELMQLREDVELGKL